MVAKGEVKAPIVIGRDHLDSGSVASPNRETEAMQDGSDAVSDWPLLNALLNSASGATWVSLHHGGGVGIGYSQHAGMVIVADGTPAAARAAGARAHQRPRHRRHAPCRCRLRHRDRVRARAEDEAADAGVGAGKLLRLRLCLAYACNHWNLIPVARPKRYRRTRCIASAFAGKRAGAVTDGLLTKPIPATGEQLPVIGMGSWITFDVGDDKAARAERVKVLQAFFDGGGAVVDSSPMYLSSQEVIGHCLAQIANKQSLFAATKVWIARASSWASARWRARATLGRGALRPAADPQHGGLGDPSGDAARVEASRGACAMSASPPPMAAATTTWKK